MATREYSLPTALLLCLVIALTTGEAVYPVTEKGACLFHPLSLADACPSGKRLVLRQLTLANSRSILPVASCARLIEGNMLQRNDSDTASNREYCCTLHPNTKDCVVTVHLPAASTRDLGQYAGLVDKCRLQAASRCDLNDVTSNGTVTQVSVGQCGMLNYVSAGYSCVPGAEVVSFGSQTFSKTFSEGRATLLVDTTADVSSSRCLLYSTNCDARVKLNVLDLTAKVNCTLLFSDETRNETLTCSSPRMLNSWNSSIFTSTANHVTIGFRSLVLPPNQTLWLEAGAFPQGSPLTVVCGTAADQAPPLPCVSTPVPTTSSFSSPSTSTTSPSLKTASVVATAAHASSTPWTEWPKNFRTSHRLIKASPTVSTPTSSNAASSLAGWSAFSLTSKPLCKFYPLTLDNGCNGTGDLALRAITLGSTSDVDCGSKINANQLRSNLTRRKQCCRHRERDVMHTVHLPPLKENALPNPYDKLVKKCFFTPTRCDLYDVKGSNNAQIPNGKVPGYNDYLSYVIPIYSCIPEKSTIGFTENRTLTAPVVSLRQEKKVAPSSKCVIYSRDCYVTISLGVINVVVRDHCVLTLEDEGHRAVTLNCTDARMYETWKGPVWTSSSNFLNVSLDFQPGTNASKQIVWLEATAMPRGSPLTVVCGTARDSVPLPPCISKSTLTSASSSRSTSLTSLPAASKTVSSMVGAVQTSTFGTSSADASTANPSTNAPFGVSTGNSSTNAPFSVSTGNSSTNAPFSVSTATSAVTARSASHGLAVPTWGLASAGVAGGLVLVAAIAVGVYACTRHSRKTSPRVSGNHSKQAPNENPSFAAEDGNADGAWKGACSRDLDHASNPLYTEEGEEEDGRNTSKPSGYPHAAQKPSKGRNSELDDLYAVIDKGGKNASGDRSQNSISRFPGKGDNSSLLGERSTPSAGDSNFILQTSGIPKKMQGDIFARGEVRSNPLYDFYSSDRNDLTPDPAGHQDAISSPAGRFSGSNHDYEEITQLTQLPPLSALNSFRGVSRTSPAHFEGVPHFSSALSMRNMPVDDDYKVRHSQWLEARGQVDPREGMIDRREESGPRIFGSSLTPRKNAWVLGEFSFGGNY